MTIRFGADRPPIRAPLVATALLVAALIGQLAWAQNFDANRYYRQCLAFEVGGDLDAAQRACENALQVDPGFAPARLGLARVEVRLGEYGSAESRLQALRGSLDSPEPDLLLAEIALESDRLGEVAGFLRGAERYLESEFNRELAARLNYLQGRVAAAQGRYEDALASYQQAIDFDGLDVAYRLADARLRLELGDADGARDQLVGYQNLAGTERNPAVRSLLGRSHWALGDADRALDAINGALTLRTSRETEAQVDDLVALSLIYYGQGNVRSGGVALRGAVQRGNLLQLALSNTLLWILVLLTLLAVLLIGESRIASTSSLEMVDGPQHWTVGEVYQTLFGALLLGVLTALAYGLLMHGDLLALFAPVIGANVRGVAAIVFFLVLALLTVQRVQRNGWDPGEVLLRGGNQVTQGVVAGLAMLVLTIAYLVFRPDVAWLGEFYFDLGALPLPIVIAAVLLPLIELHLRAFAFPAFERRYDTTIASVLSVGIYALLLGTPVPLLLVLGGISVWLYRRADGALPPLAAQLVFHVGLVVAVAFVPWVRALFL